MHISLNNLDAEIKEYTDIKTITEDINKLNSYIFLLEKQRKQMLIKYNIISNLKICCPKCNGQNLYIQKKNNGKMIGLYCKTCKKDKRTGYIKFLSKEEYNKIKGIYKEY